MSAFLELTLILTIIIFAAKAAGYLSVRLGQPAVLGELLIGLLLGPTGIDLVHLSIFTSEHLGETIAELAELGVIFLMFIAGLEINIGQLKQSGKVSAAAGVMGVILPILLGWGSALLFGFDSKAGLFIGLILAATSVSISAQTLMELKVIRNREGVALLGAAVFDDILVILGLSLFVAVTIATDNPGVMGLVWVVLRMVMYLVFATLIGTKFIPVFAERIVRLPISQGLMAAVIMMALFYAWAAEVWGGMAAITGAFLAGLLFGRTRFHERIESGMHTLSYALFVPIFFVNIGLEVNVRELTFDSGFFVVIICLIAVLSKILGSGLGARLAGFSNKEALRLGAGMVSRGEVGLIVASIGVIEGIISADIFTVSVIMVIFTTLITPPMLRTLFSERRLSSSSSSLEYLIRKPQKDNEP